MPEIAKINIFENRDPKTQKTGFRVLRRAFNKNKRRRGESKKVPFLSSYIINFL